MSVWILNSGNDLLNVFHIDLEGLDVVRRALNLESLDNHVVDLNEVVVNCLSEIEAQMLIETLELLLKINFTLLRIWSRYLLDFSRGFLRVV